jgi:hypothetical protein
MKGTVMGRGLSDLQRWILRECVAGDHVGMYYWHICLHYFKWPAHTQHQPNDFPQHFSVGNPIFRSQDIGVKEYRRVMATISRSCARLQARGLIEVSPLRYKGSGAIAAGCVYITDAGKEWLSVNDVHNLPSD